MRRYRVVIPYEEPTFTIRKDADGDRVPFKAEYLIEATSPEAAVAEALACFEGDSRDSSVGWIREPLEDAIEVEPWPEDAEPV